MIFQKNLYWNMILFFRRKMKDDLSQKNIWKYNTFCKCFGKIFLPKNLHWNMIFLVLSGKMVFLFPKNMILFFRRKMKDDLSQKNIWKYNTFCKCSGKIFFPKNMHWNMIFLVLSRNIIFLFFQKYDLIL